MCRPVIGPSQSVDPPPLLPAGNKFLVCSTVHIGDCNASAPKLIQSPPPLQPMTNLFTLALQVPWVLSRLAHPPLPQPMRKLKDLLKLPPQAPHSTGPTTNRKWVIFTCTRRHQYWLGTVCNITVKVEGGSGFLLKISPLCLHSLVGQRHLCCWVVCLSMCPSVHLCTVC